MSINIKNNNDSHDINQNLKQKYQDTISAILDKAKQRGLAAEATLKIDSGLGVTVRLGEVETVEFHQGKGLVITVYHGKKKGTASSTDISAAALHSSLDAACRLAEYTEADPFAGLPEKETLATTIPNLDLYHPIDITPEQAIDYAKATEAAALNYDKRITNSEGASFNTHQSFGLYGNTFGFLAGYPSTRYALNCTVIAEQGHSMQRDMEFTVARDKNDLIASQKLGASAAERTLKRLNARKIKTTQAPVIFLADAACSLFTHFISAISGSNLYRNSSFLLDYIGKQVFPSFIQIEEQPHLLKGLGSAPFDNEGVTTRKQSFIENGVLQRYVLSSYSARKLGLKTSGNAGGVHNLIVSHSNNTREDLIKKMQTGLIVTEMMGQGANVVTGDYSRGAFGYWVEKGEIQYPVEEITIAGNLKDMFLNLVAISKDVEKRGNIQTGSVLLEKMIIAGA